MLYFCIHIKTKVIQTTQKKVLVIGGGISGLTTANYLSKFGFEVFLVEKNDRLGGRLGSFTNDGFTFDIGPSYCWMLEVYENFYKIFGKQISDFYELKPIDPAFRFFFFEQDMIDVYKDINKQKELFKAIEPSGGNKLQKFFNVTAKKYSFVMNHWIFSPSLSIWHFLKSFSEISKLFSIGIYNSLKNDIRKYVKSKSLQSILEFTAHIPGGNSLFETSSINTIFSYSKMVNGIFYPLGGMNKIVESFEQIAKEQKVKIFKEETVESFEYEKRKIVGVKTNKRSFACDAVISTTDYFHTEKEILEEKYRAFSDKQIDSFLLTPSCLIWYIGINKKINGLQHVNLFFETDKKEYFRDVFENKKWPKYPHFYISCPSRTDPSLAPENGEVLIIQMPIAPDIENDSEPIRQFYLDQALEKIRIKTGEFVALEHIVFKKSFCVKEFKEEYNAYKGNAFGVANTMEQLGHMKPRMKSEKVKNLYFAGQTTVPGPGVSLGIISGIVASKQILKDFKAESF